MVKQVLVIRSDLKNAEGHKLRAGKLISQGAHASMIWLSLRARRSVETGRRILLSAAEQEWISGAFTKICLKVDSEDELYLIRNLAENAGLTAHIVVDSGATEFNGVPTPTCLAIGPDEASKIDAVTGGLSLY